MRSDREPSPEDPLNLTDEHWSAVLVRIRLHHRAILARRGGQPLDVADLIEETRAEQDQRNLPGRFPDRP